MTDDERAYRLRCTQLLIDLKGTPHEAQSLVEGWGRDERRRVWEEVIAEVAKNETVSPFIGPLWNAGWTERSQSLLKWLRHQAEEEGYG